MSILDNPRHERFAQALAAGKSAYDAYADAGFRPKRQNASRLMTNDAIQARVAELLSRATEGVVLTRQWVLERLIQNVNRALQAEQVMDRGGMPAGEYRYEGSIANRALELLGKELGMFVDRAELTGRGGDPLMPDQPMPNIRELAKAIIIVLAKARAAPQIEAEVTSWG